MLDANARFECVLGPDGWTVWDHAANSPASASSILIGCNETQADAAKRLLADQYRLWTDPGPWQIFDRVFSQARPLEAFKPEPD